jgi:hypothetical protein
MSSILEQKLRNLGSPYVRSSQLRLFLPKSADQRFSQVKRAQQKGLLIQIRRGLYLLGGYLTPRRAHPFELAQFIYGPSYISLESALSYHGLIPEAVYTICSVSIHRKKTFKTPLGLFSYDRLPAERFFVGVERIEEPPYVFFMATPWKAICDYVYCNKKDWTSLKPLFESLRIEPEDLPRPSPEELSELQSFYHQERINRFLRGVAQELNL